MGTGLLALGTVELEVVGFSGYSARAPCFYPYFIMCAAAVQVYVFSGAGYDLLITVTCHR